MKIEKVSVKKLSDYESNPRHHDGKQIDAIAHSISTFGFLVPVLATPDGKVVAGHGRLAAARKLKLDQVPVLRVDTLSESQIRAFRLVDNRLSEMSSWDEELLAREISALQDSEIDIDMDALGFSDQWLKGELGDLWGQPDPAQDADDAAPEDGAPLPQVTVPGDIWICGRHRVGCGDSTDAEHIERVLNGAVPNLMVTDPPYGVRYDPAWRNNTNAAGRALGGSKEWKVANDDRADWTPVWRLFPGEIAYVWHGGLHAQVVAQSLKDAGFELRAQIIWCKTHAIMSRGAYHWQHEPCWYAVRAGGKAAWATDRKQTTVWHIENFVGWNKGEGDDETQEHATQKPIECMLRPMLHNSQEGDAVFEPFLGSGSTLIAAERANRVLHASELDPRCVDVAVRRWQNRTGQAAVLARAASSERQPQLGRNFDDVTTT